MSTLTIDSGAPARQLRQTMAAVRVSFTWFGVRKALTDQQKNAAADAFGAEGSFLSAGKKLINTQHPAYKAVTSVRSRIGRYWRGISLPFPEPGIRLIRQGDLETFNRELTQFQEELRHAVDHLDAHFFELKRASREQLGRLFNASDYPDSLLDLFQVAWDFPAVEPPDYLRQLNPELYQQESERVTARFDEAARLAEEAFTSELAKLVSHLTERLSGTEDGKPKIFRDSAISNMSEFFTKFRKLNVRSNEQLDALVDQARQIVQGVDPQQLRTEAPVRQQVATQLAAVQSVLDGLLVDRPRRNILRRAK